MCAPLSANRAAAAALLRRTGPSHTTVTSSPTAIVTGDVFRLDPPCTSIQGEAEVLRQCPRAQHVVYCCAQCGAPVFTGSQLVGLDDAEESLSLDSHTLHSSGWPTFVDHIEGAVALRCALTANSAAVAQPEATSQPTTTDGTPYKLKPSLQLLDVASVRMDVNIVSRGDTFENRASMRTDVGRFQKSTLARPKTIKKRRLGRLYSRFLSAASKKLLEDRRKVLQTHTQGHCSRCDKALCLATMKKGDVSLVANPSALRATFKH